MIAWIKAHIYLRTRRRQQKHLENGKHIDSKKGTLGGRFYGGSWRGEAQVGRVQKYLKVVNCAFNSQNPNMDPEFSPCCLNSEFHHCTGRSYFEMG